MSHEVDKIGYPVDPHLRSLEFRLGDLAAQYRQVVGGLENRENIIREYLATLQEMYDLGWRGNLDIEAELPDEHMPEWYLNH
jgi:hypothetical protein